MELLRLFHVWGKICFVINFPLMLTIWIEAKGCWPFQFERRSVPLFICICKTAHIDTCLNQWKWSYELLRSKLLALLVDAQLLKVIIQVNWSDGFILKKVIYSELYINIFEAGKARICHLLFGSNGRSTKWRILVTDIEEAILQESGWRCLALIA